MLMSFQPKPGPPGAPSGACTGCGNGVKENAEQCGTLIGIQRDIERIRAEELVKAADKGGPDAPKQYEKAAGSYLELWKKYGEAACESKSPACGRSDEVLYNAARAFQAARLIAKSIAVRKILIDPKYGLEKRDTAVKAVYEIGGNYQAIAVYDEAASYYERYARESPAGERAAESLQDAVLLRLGLGQEKQALDDAELFEKSHGAKQPALSAQIAFAIGAHDAEHGDVQVAKKRLLASMRSIDRSAPLDVQIVAHALLGKVLAQTGDPAGAASEYARVKAAYRDPAALIKGLDEVPPEDRPTFQQANVVHLAWDVMIGLATLLFLMFQAVFSWATLPMDAIKAGMAALGEFVTGAMADGPLRSLLVDGVIAGAGGVLVFLPQILILFFFILLLEDSGYLPRAAFLLDRLMGGAAALASGQRAQGVQDLGDGGGALADGGHEVRAARLVEAISLGVVTHGFSHPLGAQVVFQAAQHLRGVGVGHRAVGATAQAKARRR